MECFLKESQKDFMKKTLETILKEFWSSVFLKELQEEFRKKNRAWEVSEEIHGMFARGKLGAIPEDIHGRFCKPIRFQFRWKSMGSFLKVSVGVVLKAIPQGFYNGIYLAITEALNGTYSNEILGEISRRIPRKTSWEISRLEDFIKKILRWFLLEFFGKNFLRKLRWHFQRN